MADEWIADLRPRLASLRLSPEREREILDELSQHLDDRYEELRAGGAPPPPVSFIRLTCCSTSS